MKKMGITEKAQMACARLDSSDPKVQRDARSYLNRIIPGLEKELGTAKADGGPGSGNHGHAGRPGHRGGSTSKGSMGIGKGGFKIPVSEIRKNAAKTPIDRNSEDYKRYVTKLSRSVYDKSDAKTKQDLSNYVSDADKRKIINEYLNGDRKVDQNTKEIADSMTKAISKCEIPKDAWHHATMDVDTAAKKFGMKKEDFMRGDFDSYIGKKATDAGFTECSADNQSSDSGVSVHYFLPKGTHAIEGVPAIPGKSWGTIQRELREMEAKKPIVTRIPQNTQETRERDWNARKVKPNNEVVYEPKKYDPGIDDPIGKHSKEIERIEREQEQKQPKYFIQRNTTFEVLGAEKNGNKCDVRVAVVGQRQPQDSGLYGSNNDIFQQQLWKERGGQNQRRTTTQQRPAASTLRTNTGSNRGYESTSSATRRQVERNIRNSNNQYR